MNWHKVERTVHPEGTTTTYAYGASGYIVQSRKRHIPHANRSGTWDHTSYFVLKDGVELAEKQRLSDAKEWAEQEASAE